MLKRLSKSGIYLQIIFILLLFGIYLFTPEPAFPGSAIPGNAAPLGGWIFSALPENNFALKILAAILLLANAAGYNIMLNSHDLHPRQSIFTMFIFTGFALFSGPAAAVIGPLAALLLLLISLRSMMKLFAEPYPYTLVLNASVFVALASMIYPLAALFVVFIWMAFFTLRISSWREWVISFTGLIVPYIYLAFWFFWNDRLNLALNEYRAYFNGFNLTWSKPGLSETVVLFLTGAILIASMSTFLNDAGEKIISIRKKMWINAQFLWTSLALIALSGDSALLVLPFCFLPLALMFGYYITKSRRTWINDLIFGVFLTIVIMLRSGI